MNIVTKLSTAENVALSLYENKIKFIFGMPGGGSSIDLIEDSISTPTQIIFSIFASCALFITSLISLSNLS